MAHTNPPSLFRMEVLAARSDAASGAALQIRPVGAPLLTALFGVMALAVLAVLIFGSYTKKERVQGVVQARDGVAMVVSPEAGLIKRVRVVEGQWVHTGDVIAEISNERYSDAGSTQALIEGALQGQQQQVRAQAEGQDEASAAAVAAVTQRLEQAQRDAQSLSTETQLQRQQIDSARRLLDQLQPLLADHIVSDVQYEQQHQALLAQTAKLQELDRQRSAVEADIAQARQERAKLQAQHRVTRAGLDRDLLTLQQEALQRHVTRVLLLKAPMDGIVSGLVATAGQSTPAGAPLASIVPSHSPLEAVLYVPSTAIGFIHPQQDVRLAYDAFPYPRFGLYHGVVQTVSATDVPLPGNRNSDDHRAFFMVRVRLDRNTVRAYGAEVPLRPGHTLTADVEIDRRRLIRWMLDPLLAFSGKL